MVNATFPPYRWLLTAAKDDENEAYEALCRTKAQCEHLAEQLSLKAYTVTDLDAPPHDDDCPICNPSILGQETDK